MTSSVRKGALALFLSSFALGPACNCSKPAFNSNHGQINVAPNPIAYTPMISGQTSEAVTIQVSNTGAQTLTLGAFPVAIAASGSGPIDGVTLSNVLNTNCTGSARSPSALLVFAPGECALITATWQPTSTSALPAGFVEFLSDDPTTPDLKVPVTFGGPALCADPASLNFGNASIGTTTTKTLTLTSCGTVPVSLQQPAFDTMLSPDFSSASALPGPQSLAVGAKLTIDVTLKPTFSGVESGKLNLPNSGNPGQSVSLTGNAAGCHLVASPNPISFGQVAYGQSRTIDAVVTNAGTADCHLASAAVTAGATWFSIANAPGVTIDLRPNDSYAVHATYKVPQGDMDVMDTGMLVWNSDDPATPAISVPLTGTPVPAPVCKLSVLPAASQIIPGLNGRSLVFGNVVVGHNKTLPVTLTNTGSASCNISSYKFVAFNPLLGSCASTNCDGYTFGPPAPARTLIPGASTQLEVVFSPTNTNQIPFLPNDYLQIVTSDASQLAGAECAIGFPPPNSAGCFQVALSGQGDISNLQVLPSDINFGLTTLSCNSQTQTITLYNTGTSAPINIRSIALSPVVTPIEPFVLSYPPTPFAIPAGGHQTMTVKYRPLGTGVDSAQILISTDASNTTSSNPYVTVTLNGQGTTDKHQVDTFTQSALPQVDLLWVIDDSSSFQDYQAALSAQAPKFISNAQNPDGGWKADFHIGVIGNEADMTDTTDSYSSYSNQKIYVGGLFGDPSAGGPYIIDNNTLNAGAAFAKNVKIGTCCSDSRESDAEALWDALKAPTNMTAAPIGTQGFLRDSARLIMVVVTDEIDQSHNNTAFYIDFFKQLKGQYNAGLVSFNAITGDVPGGCMSNGVTAEANPFDLDIINAVGGKFYSLCNADWGQIASDLSLGAFQGRVQFPLSRVADPATVVVTMNGAPQANPAQYHFDQPSNSVVFVTSPPANAVVVVNYDALCF
jgi:hypothetical protein